MGDPRKIRKKYKGPSHPWQRARIDAERILKREYGLTQKREIWKASSELRRINSQVKNLIREKAKGNPQAFKEEKHFLARCYKFGFVEENTSLEDVLNINIKNILNRRLQSVLLKQGLVISSKQARQFIIHGHIMVNGRRVSVPSYLVSKEEESKIAFDTKSSIASDEHPERMKKAQREQVLRDKAISAEEKTEEGELTEKELELIDKEVGGEVVAET